MVVRTVVSWLGSRKANVEELARVDSWAITDMAEVEDVRFQKACLGQYAGSGDVAQSMHVEIFTAMIYHLEIHAGVML